MRGCENSRLLAGSLCSVCLAMGGTVRQRRVGAKRTNAEILVRDRPCRRLANVARAGHRRTAPNRRGIGALRSAGEVGRGYWRVVGGGVALAGALASGCWPATFGRRVAEGAAPAAGRAVGPVELDAAPRSAPSCLEAEGVGGDEGDPRRAFAGRFRLHEQESADDARRGDGGVRRGGFPRHAVGGVAGGDQRGEREAQGVAGGERFRGGRRQRARRAVEEDQGGTRNGLEAAEAGGSRCTAPSAFPSASARRASGDPGGWGAVNVVPVVSPAATATVVGRAVSAVGRWGGGQRARPLREGGAEGGAGGDRRRARRPGGGVGANQRPAASHEGCARVVFHGDFAQATEAGEQAGRQGFEGVGREVEAFEARRVREQAGGQRGERVGAQVEAFEAVQAQQVVPAQGVDVAGIQVQRCDAGEVGGALGQRQSRQPRASSSRTAGVRSQTPSWIVAVARARRERPTFADLQVRRGQPRSVPAPARCRRRRRRRSRWARLFRRLGSSLRRRSRSPARPRRASRGRRRGRCARRRRGVRRAAGSSMAVRAIACRPPAPRRRRTATAARRPRRRTSPWRPGPRGRSP